MKHFWITLETDGEIEYLDATEIVYLRDMQALAIGLFDGSTRTIPVKLLKTFIVTLAE